MFKLLPPMSTERPTCGSRSLSRLSPMTAYVRPARTAITAMNETSSVIFLIAGLMAERKYKDYIG